MRRIVTALGMALALSLNLSACSETSEAESLPLPDVPASSAPNEPPETQALPPETEETEPTPEGPPRNDRGNIVKAFGEEGGFLDMTRENSLITFAVDGINPVQCSGDSQRYGSPPENGHLMAVDMRVATAPNMNQDGYLDYFTISSYDFQFIGPDGVTHTDLGTMVTYSCLPNSEAFTSNALNPGSQYVGRIVLDLPAPNGTLVYRPMVAEGGWEWDF